MCSSNGENEAYRFTLVMLQLLTHMSYNASDFATKKAFTTNVSIHFLSMSPSHHHQMQTSGGALVVIESVLL